MGRGGSGNVLRSPMREQMGTNHYDIRTHLFFNVTTTLLRSAFCGLEEYHNDWGGNEVAGEVARRPSVGESWSATGMGQSTLSANVWFS